MNQYPPPIIPTLAIAPSAMTTSLNICGLIGVLGYFFPNFSRHIREPPTTCADELHHNRDHLALVRATKKFPMKVSGIYHGASSSGVLLLSMLSLESMKELEAGPLRETET